MQAGSLYINFERYVPDPKMDENFHIKSSKNGWLFHHLWNHPLLDDLYRQILLSSIVGCFLTSVSGWNLYDASSIHYWMYLIITFWMKVTQYNYHPSLDVSLYQFLDESCIINLSSIFGYCLSSVLDEFSFCHSHQCLILCKFKQWK